MKRLHGSFFSASVLLAAALFSLNGCDNFMSGDKDFKAKIKQEVTIANAAKVDIRVIANAGSTTTTPSGVATVKVGVPFNIYLTKVDDNYGFVRWAAFYRNDLATELSDAVEFGNPLALETTAVLKIESSNIQIMPVCEKRPAILSKLPESSVQSAVVRNFPIKVYFSKAIDPSSFVISTDSGGSQVKRDSATGLFKNISIQGTESALEADTEFESYEKYFFDPELSASGKILTIQPRSGAGAIPPMKKIAVTLDKAIVDSSGLSMAQDYNWTYYVGASEDNEPPFFNAINAGSQPSVFFDSADEASHRIGTAGILYLSIDAADAIASVSRLYVTELLTHRADGTIPASSQAFEKYFDYIDDDNDGTTAPVFAYQLQNTTDGIIGLALQISDSNGNRTALADAPVYRVIRDTIAPDAAANSALINPAGNLNGYYNGGVNNQITLSGASQIVDAGFAGSESVLRTRSASIEWSFSFNASAGFDEWSLASTSTSLAIPSSIADGSIPLYVKFRDDLGNTSESSAVNGLLLDRTPPVPSGSSAVSIQGTTVIGEYRMLGSPDFKAALHASDSLSGMWKYLVAEGSSTPAYSDSRWTAYSDNVVASCSVSNTDGSHTLNAWFMDKAGNITAAPSTDSAFLDNTDPNVSSFFLRAAASPVQSGSGMTDPGAQYSKSTEWYFGFIASDGQGSGVGSFSYSIGSAASDYFSTGSGEIISEAQSSGSLSVSMVKRTDLGNGLYFVSGKLLLDAVNDSRSITLRVRDRVRLNTSSAGVTNGNRIVFDNRAPVVGTVSITAPAAGGGYYRGSTGTLWSASNSVTLSFSVSEARTAGEAVSGLKSYAIASEAGSSSLSGTITEQISQSPENLYAASPVKALSLSGADGFKKLLISAADHSGNNGERSFSVVLDKTAPDAIIALRKGSASIASNSIADVTGNGKDASSFTMDLSASDPAPGDGSAGAGVKTGAAHEFSLYFRTNAGAEHLVPGSEKSVALGSSSATVDLPVNGALGRPLSGTYIAQVAVIDNVENMKTARAGYYFDQTPPSFAAAPSVFNVSGGASLVYQDPGTGTYFVNTPQVVFRTAATDKPSADPDGSGISSGRILWTRTDSSGIVTSGSTESAAASESSVTDPVLRYVWSGSGVNGSSAAAVSSKPFALANGSKYLIKTAFVDAAGNESDSGSAASFTVSLDQTSPAFSAFTAGFGSEVVHHSKRYGKTPALQFTPSDGLNGSGVRAWKVDSSSAVYALAASVSDSALTSGGWTLYGSGSVNGAAAFAAILSQNTAVKGYIHLMDFAGNHSTRDLDSTGTNSFVQDTTSPTVSAVVARTDGKGFPGALNFTTTPNVKITLTITETGVGLKTLTLAGPYTVTAVTPTSGAHVSSITGSGKLITFTSTDNLPDGTAFTVELAATLDAGDGLKTLSVTAADALGNNGGAAGTGSIYLDEANPVITGFSLTNVDFTSGGGTRFVNTRNRSLSLSGTDGTSGLRTRKLSGAISTVADASWGPAPAPSATTSKTESVPISLTEGDGEKSITLEISDWSGRTASQSYAVTLDTTAPAFAAVVNSIGGEELYRKEFSTDSATALALNGYSYIGASTHPSFNLALSGASDGGGSGIASSAYALFRKSASGVENVIIPSTPIVLDGSGNGSAAIVLPKSADTTFTLSGQYFAEITVPDNVLNKVVHRVGHVYDQRKPVVTAVECTNASGSSYRYEGGRYWLGNDDVLYIRARATDRPTVDPDGSGIVKITAHTSTNGGTSFVERTYVASTDVTDSAGGSIIYEPGNAGTWFFLKNKDSAGAPSYYFDTDTQIYFTFEDAMGNASDPYPSAATPFVFMRDSTSPEIAGFVVSSATSGVTAGFTPSADVSASFAFTEIASGLSELTFTGVDVSSATFVWNGTTYGDDQLVRTPATGAKTTLTLKSTATLPIGTNQTITVSGMTLADTAADGAKPVTVTLRDSAGNSDATSASSSSIGLDTTPPNNPSITPSLPANAHLSTAGKYYVSSADALNVALGNAGDPGTNPSGFRSYGYSIDSGSETWTADDASALSVTASAGAENVWKVYRFYERDWVGNKNTAPAVLELNLDVTSPGKPTLSAHAAGTGEFIKPDTVGTGNETWFTANSTITFALGGGSDSGSGFKHFKAVWNNGGTLTDVIGTTSGVTLTATGTATAYSFYAVDNVGNVSLACEKTVTLRKDTDVPLLGAGLVFTPAAYTWAYESSNTVYVKSGTIDFTVTDSGVGSGRYVFTTTSSAPNDWGSLAWTHNAPVTVNISDVISASAAQAVWLHVKDNTGRVLAGVQLYYSDAADVWRLDETAPVVDATHTLSGKPSVGSVHNGAALFTAGASPKLTYRLADTYTITDLAVASGAADISGFSITSTPGDRPTGDSVVLSTTDATKIYVFDKVGNFATVTVNYVLDDAEPALDSGPTFTATTGDLSGGGSGATLAGYGQGFNATFAASDVLSNIAFYAVSTADAAESVATANSVGGTNGWNAWTGSSKTVDFTGLVESTPTAVYLYVKDGVGNILKTQLSLSETYPKWAKDTSAPTIPAGIAFSSATNTWVYENTATNTVYVKSGTINFTVNDAGVGSGAYTFSQTSVTPTDWGSLTWSAGTPVKASLPTFILTSGSGVQVWLHVKDNTGRVLAGVRLQNTDSSDVWRLDAAVPTVPSTAPIVGSSGSANAIFTGGYIGTDAYPKLVHKGDGPFSVTISSGGDDTRGIKGYASSATDTPVAAGGSISLTPGTSSIYVFDGVGNYTPVSVTYTADNAAPTLTTGPTFAATTGTLSGGGSGATLACYGQGFTTTFAASDTPSLVVSYAVSTAADSASVAAGNSVDGGSATNGWNSWTGSSKTVNFTGIVAATPTEVYLYVSDGVGNILKTQLSYDATHTKWAKDSSAPSITTGPAFTKAANTWVHEDSNIVYIKDGTFSFTPSDVGIETGLWLIATSSTAPTAANWTAASSAGQTWTSGTPVTGIAIPSSVTDSASTSLYVHLKDAVGLTDKFEINNSGTGDKWRKDTTAPTVNSSHKLSGTPAAGTTHSGTALFSTGAPPTLTYRLADSYVVSSLAVASGDSDISGFTTVATPSDLPTGTSVTLVTADSSKIYVFDKVGNKTEVSVVYTSDTTPPEFSDWSSSDTTDDWKITSSMVSSTSDVAVGKYKKYADADWTTLSAYNELTGLLYDTLYHMFIKDAVGNEAQVFFKASYVSTTHTLTRVNHPMNWSWISGTGPVSGLGLSGAASGTNTVVGGSATGTVVTGSSTITGVTAAGNYTLVLTDAKAKTLTLSYTLTGGSSAVALYTGAGAVNASVIGARYTATEKQNGAYLVRAYKEAIADEGKAAVLWTEKPAAFARRASTVKNGSAPEAQGRTVQDTRTVLPNALFVPVVPERGAPDAVVRDAPGNGISSRHAASLARFKQNSSKAAGSANGVGTAIAGLAPGSRDSDASPEIGKSAGTVLIQNAVWDAQDGENGEIVKKTSRFTEYGILDEKPLLRGVYFYMKSRGFDPASLMDFTL